MSGQVLLCLARGTHRTNGKSVIIDPEIKSRCCLSKQKKKKLFIGISQDWLHISTSSFLNGNLVRVHTLGQAWDSWKW